MVWYNVCPSINLFLIWAIHECRGILADEVNPHLYFSATDSICQDGGRHGGAAASWLACSPLDWAVRDQALAKDVVLCSWERPSTLTVPLSTWVYKWIPANLKLGRGVTLQWTSIPSRDTNCLMLQKPEIRPSLIGHLVCVQTRSRQVRHLSEHVNWNNTTMV